MNPYYRTCAILMRLVAVCCFPVSILNLTVYCIKSRHANAPINPGHCLYLSIPLVLGLVILIRSSAWARRLADYLDE
jgi:hypothetical protein